MRAQVKNRIGEGIIREVDFRSRSLAVDVQGEQLGWSFAITAGRGGCDQSSAVLELVTTCLILFGRPVPRPIGCLSL